MKRPINDSEINEETGDQLGLKDDGSGMEDVRCGCCNIYPKWLQICASKKSFTVTYTIVLTLLYAMNSYFIGTISTIEKNYKMTSKMLGSIKGTAEIVGLAVNFGLTYFIGKGNKALWMAFGMVVLGISSFIRTIPHFIHTSSHTLNLYVTKFNAMGDNQTANTSLNLFSFNEEEDCDNHNYINYAGEFAFYMFLFGHVIFEMGAILLKTAGVVYLDDNTRKNIFPLLFSIIHAIRTVGTTFGFLLASYTLQIFVDPNLTPDFDKNDPRWIGAWWIGWIPIGTIFFLLSGFLMLFPATLPRAALRRKNLEVETESESVSMCDFFQTVKRVLKNKMVLLDSLSSVCTKIGLAAFEIFLPKYIESQFGMSASEANFLIGFIIFLSKSSSVLIVGLIITQYQPTPRTLMSVNVLIGLLTVVLQISYILIDCPQPHMQGFWNPNRLWNFTAKCNQHFECSNKIKYSPVCSIQENNVYYSPCHAGCSFVSMINNTKIFEHCTCVGDQLHMAVDGPCSSDCTQYIVIFFVILGIFRFLRTSSKSVKKIMRFRYVEEKDKSLSLGINKALLSFLAAFPSPIIYGMIIDWACMIFDKTCGTTGNCWLYETSKLRYVLNLTASIFFFVGTILEGFLWYFIKELKMYDEDFENSVKNNTMKYGNEKSNGELDYISGVAESLLTKKF